MFVQKLTIIWLIADLQLVTAFYQDDYEVTLDIVEVIRYNNTVLRNLSAVRQWYNRTTRIINAAGTLLKDLSMHVKVDIEHYKFLSNEYRFFPMSMTGNLCTELQSHNFGLKDIMDKCSNLKTCPYIKGQYYGRNCYIDYSKFPPHVPRGKYKLVAMFYNNKDFLAEVHVYSTVVDKNKWIGG